MKSLCIWIELKNKFSIVTLTNCRWLWFSTYHVPFCIENELHENYAANVSKLNRHAFHISWTAFTKLTWKKRRQAASGFLEVECDKRSVAFISFSLLCRSRVCCFGKSMEHFGRKRFLSHSGLLLEGYVSEIHSRKKVGEPIGICDHANGCWPTTEWIWDSCWI